MDAWVFGQGDFQGTISGRVGAKVEFVANPMELSAKLRPYAKAELVNVNAYAGHTCSGSVDAKNGFGL